ncbi:hypothetical protein CEP53_004785 [Fusarium sp. AF-6]|nr:hypothetical protein CEP53_004785 [Fusarium sp. AF-6]
MKVLIFGGTGMIGGTTALSLRSLGHEVTIAGRKPSPPPEVPALAELSYIQGDYLNNGEAIPAFARLARDSVVRIFVNIGNYTHHVAPELVKAAAYVRSRKQVADGSAAVARALNNSAAIGGQATVLGDENWTMAEYWGMFFKAAGSNVKIEASDEDHTLPRSFIFAGRDPADVGLLGGYRRHKVFLYPSHRP